MLLSRLSRGAMRIQFFTALFASILTTAISAMPADYPEPWQVYDDDLWGQAYKSFFAGFEAFRGLPDADWGDNFGTRAGFQLGGSLPYLEEEGLGFQFGTSVGAYDFAGHSLNHRHLRSIQTQEFITVGAFFKPRPRFPFRLAIAYDWMLNQNYSFYADSPIIEQVRGLVSYFVSPWDECGFWASYDSGKTEKKHRIHDCQYRIAYRAIPQVNFFWRHSFGQGVESTVWVGTPIRNRLYREDSNRAGKYILGIECIVPFFESWAFTGKACYMQPGTSRGAIGAREYAADIVFSLVYFLDKKPISERTLWKPYLPLADNSNFFVDTALKNIYYGSKK